MRVPSLSSEQELALALAWTQAPDVLGSGKPPERSGHCQSSLATSFTPFMRCLGDPLYRAVSGGIGVSRCKILLEIASKGIYRVMVTEENTWEILDNLEFNAWILRALLFYYP